MHTSNPGTNIDTVTTQNYLSRRVISVFSQFFSSADRLTGRPRTLKTPFATPNATHEHTRARKTLCLLTQKKSAKRNMSKIARSQLVARR